jgi:hypothetical protein
MNSFAPAAAAFADNVDNGRSRPALLHNPVFDVARTRAILDGVGATDWPAYELAGESGTWVTPKGGIPVSEFAAVLLALGDQWMLRADPRS